jgi:hypothetical protein
LSRTLLNKYGASKLIDFWLIWSILTNLRLHDLKLSILNKQIFL